MDLTIIKKDWNPWEASSIFDFSYFCCPECDAKSQSKQDFVDHASNYHTWALEILRQIPDGSLDDIDFPGEPVEYIPDTSIKQESFYDPDEPEIDIKNVDMIENGNDLDSRLPFNSLDVKNENNIVKSDRKTKKKTKKDSKKTDIKKLKTFKCASCNASYRFKCNLQTHVESVHEGKKPFKCPSCDAAFAMNGRLKAHVENVHEKKRPFKCEICNRGFYAKDQLRIHIESVHEKKRPYICDICGKSYPTKCNLSIHTKRVHEGKMRISCKECPLTFTTRNALKYHVTMIHQLKGKSIDETNISELCENPDVAEIIQKKLLKKIYCKVCEKYVFGRASHISEQHNEKQGKVKCPKCDKSFKNYNLTMNHILNEHERKPCSVCGEIFSTKTMARHIQQSHTSNDEKRFKCEQCGKGFVANNKLQDHMNTHTGKKPYICKFCGKGFASLGTHRMHERMHAGYRRTK